MIWLFDNGHGGMVGQKYLTKGKRSPEVIPGLGIYEGEFNRDIVKRVVGRLRFKGIYAFDIVPEAKNVKLRERVERANAYMSDTIAGLLNNPSCRLISIHANADGRDGEWTAAEGMTIFHYPGSKKGEALAKKAEMVFYHADLGMWNRGIKTARFAMLRRTRMPAILVEHGFMTNRGDARKLASDKFRSQVAEAYVDMVCSLDVDL